LFDAHLTYQGNRQPVSRAPYFETVYIILPSSHEDSTRSLWAFLLSQCVFTYVAHFK